MKKYILHLMQYTRDANSKMMRILEGLSEADLNADRGAFAKSLCGVLDHLTTTAIFYQKAFKAAFPSIGCLSHEYAEKNLDFRKLNFSSFDEIKSAIRVLDDSYVGLAQSLSDEDLEKSIPIVTPRVTLEQTPGMILLRYSNHGTHHRGQISQILDEMHVDNDYSGIAQKYE